MGGGDCLDPGVGVDRGMEGSFEDGGSGVLVSGERGDF